MTRTPLSVPPVAELQLTPIWQRFFADQLPQLWLDWGSFTYARLPPAPREGDRAYCTNGRKVGEGAGMGTGVPVYWSAGAWRVYSTDAAVTV